MDKVLLSAFKKEKINTIYESNLKSGVMLTIDFPFL